MGPEPLFKTPPEEDPRNLTQPPGKSKGILGWIKDKLGGWFGPRASVPPVAGAQPTPAAEDLSHEKAKSGPPGIVFPWFLPYFDDHTGETSQIRFAYRKMLADPNVKSALLGKILDVSALDLEIHPARKGSKKHRKIADYVTWNLEERLRGCVPELIWSILSGGCVDGYSVCEKVFAYQEMGKYQGKWPLVSVKPKDTGNDVILQTDEFRNVVGVMGLRYNAGLVFSPSRFLIYRHLPLFDAPTGMSDLRAAYKHWWMLDTCEKLRAMAAEKRSVPFLMGTYQTSSQKPSLELVLASAKSHNWAAVPEGVRIEAIEISGSADSIFKEFRNDCVHGIFLGIQGAILQSLEGSTTEGRGDSRVHRSTADLLVWYLASTIKSLFNDREQGLIKDMVDLNYVTDEYPRATLSAIDLQELKSELDIDTGLWRMGLDLSKEELYERYNRTPPQSDEDRLPGQGTEPPGGDGGGEGGGGGGLEEMLGGGGGEEEEDAEGDDDDDPDAPLMFVEERDGGQ